jgi:hypothetical protein
MTTEEKLAFLVKVLKKYAEKEHCYDVYGDDYDLNPEDDCDDAFDDGSEYGEILFARTLLEQIGEDFEYPCMKKDD